MDSQIVPKVDIFEDGKPVSQERIDPGVVSFIFQAAQLAQTVKLRKLEESKVPTGVKPFKLTITDTTTKLSLYPPWISFELINDGTGDIIAWINDEQVPLQLEGMITSGDTYACDMHFPVIHTLYLKADVGETAIVRIYGEQGKSPQ